jgi:hypothetical protein
MSAVMIVGELLLQAVMHHASGREAPDDLTMVCFGRVDSQTGDTTGLHKCKTT